jgi:SulP family sulfate permease
LKPSRLELSSHWLFRYRSDFVAGDITAAIVTTLLLVPQSVAYALLAHLPPQMGLYASIFPPLAYAVFGSSNTLSVGPMAITSLMTAAALAPLAAAGTPLYIVAAAWLALMSGAGLFFAGVFRFGFLAQLLSRPVLSGFTTAAALTIAWRQLPPLFGLRLDDIRAIKNLQWLSVTAAMGVLSLLALWFSQRPLAHLLARIGINKSWALMIARLMPAMIVAAATVVTAMAQLDIQDGLAVVGVLQPQWPALNFDAIDRASFGALVVPALMIGLVNFVSSVSIAQSLAALRNEHIDANAELRGLGAANIAAGLCGGLPVNGGLSRSAVNFAAGAQTPLAGVISAGLMLLVVLIGGELFRHMPVSVLAATIVMALLGLVDVKTLRQAWRYDRADAAAWLITAGGVLLLGVVEGIVLGVATAVISLVWRSSHPHIAVLGRLTGTEQFRNIERYKVERLSHALFCRIDENLFFGNIQAVDARLREELAGYPETRQLVLVMSSVSQIDMTALESLLQLNRDLAFRQITMHLAEVKGPVIDRLRQTPFLEQLSGRVFISTFAAYVAMDGDAEQEYVI